MTKQEFLDALAVTYHQVGVPVLDNDRSQSGINIYNVIAYDLTAEGMRPLNVGFAVDDESGPAEAAYFLDRDPAAVPVGQQFITDVQAFVAAKIADSTIEAAQVTWSDSVAEKATAWVWRDIAGQLTEEKYLLFRDGGGDIAFDQVDVVVFVGS